MQNFSGQKWVNLAVILALIAIVVVVALSLIGPDLGTSVTSVGGELNSPVPSLSTSHPEGSATMPSLHGGDLADARIAYSLPH